MTASEATGLFLLLTATAALGFLTAFITGSCTNILDTHTASEERNREEKTDDKYRDRHENPGHRFETGEAESLEHTGSYNSYDGPVKESREVAD